MFARMFLLGTAAVVAVAVLPLALRPVNARAGEMPRLCAPVEAVRPVMEVLDFELMWMAYDGGKAQKDLRRVRVSCLDGSAELFRKAR